MVTSVLALEKAPAGSVPTARLPSRLTVRAPVPSLERKDGGGVEGLVLLQEEAGRGGRGHAGSKAGVLDRVENGDAAAVDGAAGRHDDRHDEVRPHHGERSHRDGGVVELVVLGDLVERV